MTVSHHHANDANSVRAPSVHVVDARAIDAGARPNSSNSHDDTQPSQGSRNHPLWLD